MWYNCTNTQGDCTYSSVYYNDYTGSMYSLTKNRKEQSDTYVMGDKRHVATSKATGIILSIILTIGLCIPICSFFVMTRKRVYKDGGPVTEAQEGIRVEEWGGNNGINADEGVPGMPIEEHKGLPGQTPAKNGLIDKTNAADAVGGTLPKEEE